ncbi:MAG: hypothetical protein IJM36_03420 [Acholeplasmatales bacterium]|nr:hypothetical protein [Acholeplasmatales bacterium]
MVKARDILYKVSAILSLVFAIIWAVVTVIYLIAGVVTIIAGALSMADGGDASGLVGGIGFLFFAIWFAVMSVCSFINMGLSKKAPVENTKKTYIISIVFSVLSGTEVGIVGAIFGLVLLNQNQQASDDKVVEAEVVEAKTEEAPKEEAKPEEAPQEEAKPEEPAEKTDAE